MLNNFFSHIPDIDQYQDRLFTYIDSILLWNSAYNLTAITNRDEAIIKHLYDSLALYSPLLERLNDGARLIDVGSGAGLPGIPLSIVMPNMQFTLLDSGIKRVRFMRQMIIELGLTNVDVVHSRVQDFNSKNPYDAILSRAFASGEDMIDWTEHLCGKDGFFAAMKGVYNSAEWQEFSHYKQEVVELDVPLLNEARHLVLLFK